MKHFIPSIEPLKLHLRADIFSEILHALISRTLDTLFQTGGATNRNTALFQLYLCYYI